MTSDSTSTDVPPGPLLAVSEVGTGYGDLRVVWDVSLEVYAGRISVLLGRNGAGKTSTLRAIVGLNKLMAGSIEFDGRDIAGASVHDRVARGMAYVQEGKRIFSRLSVENNLLLGGYPHRREGRKALRTAAQRVYDLFPILHEKRALLAGSMSGGQQQMLAIGQALMARPRLLLLDEPSGGLAPVIVNEVMERVHELKETGLGILLVEQAVEASFAIADHVTVLDTGRAVLSAEAADVGGIAALQQAYFGRQSTPD